MKSARAKSLRCSGGMQTTASTQTAASVFTTGSGWSPWTWSPPTQGRPAPGSLGWNTSWLVSVMKTVWPGGSAPVINILYPASLTHHYISGLFKVDVNTSTWDLSDGSTHMKWPDHYPCSFFLNRSLMWLQQTFSEADKNGDGTLSIGEVHQLLHKLNVNLPKQKVRQMFQVRL